MNTHQHPKHLNRPLARPGWTLGLFVTLALAATACSEPGSSIAGPDLLSPDASNAASHNSSGTTSDFTVLANAAVTCTDGSIIGDVGTYEAPPTGSFTDTNCVVDGSIHLGDAAAVQAYEDFLAEYDALELVECGEVLTGDLNGVTLTPGVYCFDAAATLAGTLTLTGSSDDSWLFKVGTSGTGALTGSGFEVVMDGGAEECNVTWWVADAATMTDSDFIGSILAGAAITLTRGTFHGNAWAGASGVGDVTITGTDVTGCESSAGNNGSEPGSRSRCNQGVGNGPEGCDPGNSNHRLGSNDEDGGTPGNPGRKGGGR
jgi:hypothetical protein